MSLLVWGVLSLLPVSTALSQGQVADFPPETAAKVVVLMDADTGAILLDKNGSAPFPPASLAKLMTAEIVFGALKTGELAPEAALPVSDHAWRTGGAPSRTATMFASVRSQIPVDALAQGLTVQAANDAALILAERIGGTDAGFAALMNQRATELGMMGSRFVNSTGLPQEGQEVTAEDMAVLGRHVFQTYPDWYALYSQPDFEWNKIRQRNRNPLLGSVDGASGMVAGFSPEGGFALVGAATRDGRTTIMAMAGVESEPLRVREAAKLFGWAQTSFERSVLFKAAVPVAEAPVFGGVVQSVPLVLSEDLSALIPIARSDLVKATVQYDAPLMAPIEKGQKLGVLNIEIAGQHSLARDLIAGADIGGGTFSSRAAGAVSELAFGWIRSL
ncbi:D-alanyl-D-alanine carboxypeptidase family protein [Aureimonas sp. ME7]|uniref:D-alanyl-D-alanine carboxypeptidase family protein n=1 Tax=Aureimonas sp. ME7 TaxID=2744252 RepID=UPI001FCE62A3|nr:D-alanyl-D-alanine carboxypeptidase family protein [Aureimonas sp. ME7]